MVQPLLVAGIDHNRCLNYLPCFWPDWSPRTASISRVEFSYRRPVGHRSGRNFSSDASLDARARELVNRLCCCIESDHFASSELLVADRFRAGGVLFRLHLATLCRKGKRSARHSRFLLGRSHDLRPLIRPGCSIFSGADRACSKRNALDFPRTTRSRRANCFGIGETWFKAGDRLAILLPNEPDYIELVYACAWLGVTAVPLNTRLSVKKSTASLATPIRAD